MRISLDENKEERREEKTHELILNSFPSRVALLSRSLIPPLLLLLLPSIATKEEISLLTPSYSL